MKMQRNKAPQYLKDNQAKWTQEYLNKKPKPESKNKPSSFYWHGVYDQLLTDLKKLSGKRCAFCDRPMSPIGDTEEEIEHFKPKSYNKYPELAFEWTNLYPICPKCNKIKGSRFSDLLLRPDSNNYGFDKWFWFNPFTGELDIKSDNKKSIEYKQAEKTIEFYGLNRTKLVERRKFVSKSKTKNKGFFGGVLPFRYIKIKKGIFH